MSGEPDRPDHHIRDVAIVVLLLLGLLFAWSLTRTEPDSCPAPQPYTAETC